MASFLSSPAMQQSSVSRKEPVFVCGRCPLCMFDIYMYYTEMTMYRLAILYTSLSLYIYICARIHLVQYASKELALVSSSCMQINLDPKRQVHT